MSTGGAVLPAPSASITAVLLFAASAGCCSVSTAVLTEPSAYRVLTSICTATVAPPILATRPLPDGTRPAANCCPKVISRAARAVVWPFCNCSPTTSPDAEGCGIAGPVTTPLVGGGGGGGEAGGGGGGA